MDEGVDVGLQKLQEAKETFPELYNERSLVSMAQDLDGGGIGEAAIAVFKNCLESFPDSADAYFGLGISYLGLGQNQEAIESFESNLKIRKGNRLGTRGLQWAREALKVERNPVILAAEEMKKFTGNYGPRHITLLDGQLYYQRDGRPKYRLIPLNKNTFALEGYGPFRIQFHADESGQITKIIGLYIQGNTDQSLRDKN
jgi:tetratricopeptide (TPR) repeat protein